MGATAISGRLADILKRAAEIGDVPGAAAAAAIQPRFRQWHEVGPRLPHQS